MVLPRPEARDVGVYPSRKSLLVRAHAAGHRDLGARFDRTRVFGNEPLLAPHFSAVLRDGVILEEKAVALRVLARDLVLALSAGRPLRLHRRPGRTALRQMLRATMGWALVTPNS